jgi:hypothetical protein
VKTTTAADLRIARSILKEGSFTTETKDCAFDLIELEGEDHLCASDLLRKKFRSIHEFPTT